MPTGATIQGLRRLQRRETWYLIPSQIGANCPNQERSMCIKYPISISQLNWKSTTSKGLTKEAIDVAYSTSTSLAPVQRSQLMNTPSTPSSSSPTASTKVTDSDYCAICTLLDKEGDQAKEKDQTQPEDSPYIFITATQT